MKMKEEIVTIIKEQMQEKAPFILAIDGKAGSGKSTLADWLKKELNASLIPMDDFFLPPELRSKERLAKPGANVHYERFLKEIIPYIKQGVPFSYQPFDCSLGEFSQKITIPPNSMYIVEGSYSLHPKFEKYYDYSIFVDVSDEEQMRRIKKRNGEYAKIFADKWIPLENSYFRYYQIKEKADYVFNTSLRI